MLALTFTLSFILDPVVLCSAEAALAKGIQFCHLVVAGIALLGGHTLGAVWKRSEARVTLLAAQEVALDAFGAPVSAASSAKPTLATGKALSVLKSEALCTVGANWLSSTLL